jgi:hypothetical protein
MKLTEMNEQEVRLVDSITTRYKWIRQTMQLQEQLQRKSHVYEKAIISEYNWIKMTFIKSENNILRFLSVKEIIEELELFIIKWDYTKNN